MPLPRRDDRSAAPVAFSPILVLAIVLPALVPSAGGPAVAGPAPAPAPAGVAPESSAVAVPEVPLPDLSGVWVLDERASDDPDQLMPRFGRGGEGGGRGGMGGMGGMGGQPGEMGGMTRGGQVTGTRTGQEPQQFSPADIWARLLITHMDGQFEVEDGTGRSRRFVLGAPPVAESFGGGRGGRGGPGGRPGRGEGAGLMTRAYTERGAIVVVTEREGTPIRTATYRLDARTGQLEVTILPLRRGAAAEPVELVYNRK